MNSLSRLQGATAVSTDGEAGTVKDVYFDDERWTVRYLVVKSGGWLSGRKVLVSPRAVTGVDWAQRKVNLDLTKEQIRNSPDIDTDKPVSRQHEAEFSAYYGYPYYWSGPLVWGYAAYPAVQPLAEPPQAPQTPVPGQAGAQQQQGDPSLRSTSEVTRYEIRATDDSIGHVEDFLIDDRDWSIRLMVVDTGNWWPGKKVLIAPDRIDHVSWQERRLAVNITRAQVEGSPEYDPARHTPDEAGGGLYRVGSKPFF